LAGVVNLRLARKARARADAAKAADAARAKAGVSKADRRLGDSERARTGRVLEGAKRDPD
jgi:Domain of unknown function (DUF4169)